jgi:hypothetical protein
VCVVVPCWRKCIAMMCTDLTIKSLRVLVTRPYDLTGTRLGKQPFHITKLLSNAKNLRIILQECLMRFDWCGIGNAVIFHRRVRRGRREYDISRVNFSHFLLAELIGKGNGP